MGKKLWWLGEEEREEKKFEIKAEAESKANDEIEAEYRERKWNIMDSG